MAWTTTGTVSVTNNSAIVYGAGTSWASSNLVRGGDIFKAPDGNDYQVLSVQSNTQLTLATAYLGMTASAQSYALIHTGLLPAELAVDLSDLQSKYLVTVAQLYDWETSTDATVPLTNPATNVTTDVKPIAGLIADIGTKAPKSAASFTDGTTIIGPVGGIAASFTDETNSSLFIKPQVGGVFQDTAGGGAHRWGTNNNVLMTLNSFGYLGFNTPPATPLHIVSSVGTEIARMTNQNSAGQSGTVFYNDLANFLAVGIRGSAAAAYPGEAIIETSIKPISVVIGGLRRAKFGVDGGVEIGGDATITSGVWPLTTKAQNRGTYSVLTDNSGYGAYFAVNGGATVSGSINLSGNTASYTSSSDYRLKYDDSPFVNALERISALRPIQYKWKSDDSIGEGFFAHELQAVCPLAVTGQKDQIDDNSDPVYQSVDMAKIVPTLVAAMQEQQGMIAALQARIAVLEAA